MKTCEDSRYMENNRLSHENLKLSSLISQKFKKKSSILSMGTHVDSTKASKSFIKRSGEKSFTCYMCSKPFPSQSEVIMHLKFHHNACASRDCSRIADVRLHSSVCRNRPFDCSVCYKKFSEKYLLQIHFNQHIDVAFYICELCRDGFQQRKDLQKHMLEIHEKNVTIPVTPACTKKVYQKCSNCSKYFQLFSEYEEHSFMCNTQMLECKICKINVPSPHSLKEHDDIEHKQGVPVKGFLALKEGKRYFCGICYLGFFKGNILKAHIKTHEMDKDYICDECHLSFTSDDDLQAHYLCHIEEHYVLQDVIRQHSCDGCKRTFKNQKDLISHKAFGFCKKGNVSLFASSNTSPPHNDLKNNGMSNHKIKSNIFSTTELIQNTRTQSTKKNASAIESEKVKDYSENVANSLSENVSENNLESDIFGSKPCDFPVYALKAGDELINCDDGNCIIVIDRESLFVLQRGICANESRMPDVSNAEAYSDSDVIDATSLQNHMFHILNVKEDSESSDENMPNSEVNGETFTLLEQKLNAESESSEVVTINLSELNAQLASDPSFKDHQIYIESIPVSECENSESCEMIDGHTYKIIVNEDSLANIESSAITPELSAEEVVAHENKVPYINELIREAVVQNPDLVKMA